MSNHLREVEHEAISPAKMHHLNGAIAEPSSPTLQAIGVPVTRSTDLWFDDGNIVLQAQNTQFRIHRSSVSVHSTFFNDVLSIQQPSEGLGATPEVDGCPLIILPDPANEWSDLLMAMYNIFKTSPNPNEYPLSRALSLLRLGHKYRFDYFRDIAASRIKSQLPRSVLEWHIASSCRAPKIGHRHPTEDLFAAVKGYEFDLVNVALEVGMLMQSVLPVAYLLCLHNCTLDEILDGIHCNDGTRSQLSIASQRTLISSQVEIAQMSILHIGLDPLRHLQQAQLDGSIICDAYRPGTLNNADKDSAASPNPSQSPSPSPCTAHTPESHEWLLRLLSEPEIGLELNRPGGLEVMCAPCSDFVKFRIHRGQEKFWDEFPVAFGLSRFSGLRDD